MISKKITEYICIVSFKKALIVYTYIIFFPYMILLHLYTYIKYLLNKYKLTLYTQVKSYKCSSINLYNI